MVWHLDAAVGCNHVKAAAQYDLGADLREDATNNGQQENG
jgi:hypothetical protein